MPYIPQSQRYMYARSGPLTEAIMTLVARVPDLTPQQIAARLNASDRSVGTILKEKFDKGILDRSPVPGSRAFTYRKHVVTLTAMDVLTLTGGKP